MNTAQMADLNMWKNRKNNLETDLRIFLEERKGPENTPCLARINKEIIDTKLLLDNVNGALAKRASPDRIKRYLSQLNPKI